MQFISGPSPKSEILLERVKARVKVIQRLVEGELSLLEAAAWFRFLGDHPAELPDDFRSHYPGRSDGEKACRQVIGWTESHLRARGDYSTRERLLRGLEDELNALCGEHEVIELPW
jgi:hypothetical protein